MLHIIFCGGRNWNKRDPIRQVMKAIQSAIGTFLVIEGEAPGADSIARSLAELELDLPFKAYPANWTLYGKAAGPIRNTQMLKEANGICAFHDNLQQSKGTKNMVEQGLKSGVPVWICTQGMQALQEFILQLLDIKEAEKESK